MGYLIILIVLTLILLDNVMAIDVTECGDLTQANGEYVLIKDITNNFTGQTTSPPVYLGIGLDTPNCINIYAVNITLDCADYIIDEIEQDLTNMTYWGPHAAIYSNAVYTTIKNCNVATFKVINTGDGYGSMYLGFGVPTWTNASGDVLNGTDPGPIFPKGHGIVLEYANHSRIINVTSSNQDYGINLIYTDNAIIENSVFDNNLYKGIHLIYSSNNRFINTVAGEYDEYNPGERQYQAIFIYKGRNNVFEDVNITTGDFMNHFSSNVVIDGLLRFIGFGQYLELRYSGGSINITSLGGIWGK